MELCIIYHNNCGDWFTHTGMKPRDMNENNLMELKRMAQALSVINSTNTYKVVAVGDGEDRCWPYTYWHPLMEDRVEYLDGKDFLNGEALYSQQKQKV